jgi:hypothetical protein
MALQHQLFTPYVITKAQQLPWSQVSMESYLVATRPYLGRPLH